MGTLDSFLAVLRPGGKKERQTKTAVERGREGRASLSPLVTKSRGGREWLVVAPGYLEEGLLHSEAGQQN